MGVSNSTARRLEFSTGRRNPGDITRGSKARRAAAIGPTQRPARRSRYAARLPRQDIRTRLVEDPFPMVTEDVLDPAFDEFDHLDGHVDGLAAYLRADQGRCVAWNDDTDA